MALAGFGVEPATHSGRIGLPGAGSRHNKYAKDVHTDQLPNRGPEQHRDLDNRRFRRVVDDLHHKLSSQEPLHNQRDVHADCAGKTDGAVERGRQRQQQPSDGEPVGYRRLKSNSGDNSSPAEMQGFSVAVGNFLTE